MSAKKVLLIENEKCLQQILLIMLMLEGFDAVGVESGIAGFDLARSYHPDIVLCDLRMPEIGGDTVLKLLRQNPDTQSIPFICMSADDQTDAPQEVRSLKSGDYLRKPFSRNDLLQSIQLHLQQEPA